MALLIIKRPGIADQQVILPEEGEDSIGRTAGNTIVIDDALVSRQHALLSPEPSGHRVSDLGSRNGKRLEGEGQLLRNGNRIMLGENQVVLSYYSEDATLAADDTTSRWGVLMPWQMQGPSSRWRFLVWLRLAGIFLGIVSGALGITFWLLKLVG